MGAWIEHHVQLLLMLYPAHLPLLRDFLQTLAASLLNLLLTLLPALQFLWRGEGEPSDF